MIIKNERYLKKALKIMGDKLYLVMYTVKHGPRVTLIPNDLGFILKCDYEGCRYETLYHYGKNYDIKRLVKEVILEAKNEYEKEEKFDVLVLIEELEEVVQELKG